MTYVEMQQACRALVYGAGLSSFTLTVQTVEHHPNRIDTRWSIFVMRDCDAIPAPAPGSEAHLYRTEADPAALLRWLKNRLATAREAQPSQDMLAIGEIPIAVGD